MNLKSIVASMVALGFVFASGVTANAAQPAVRAYVCDTDGDAGDHDFQAAFVNDTCNHKLVLSLSSNESPDSFDLDNAGGFYQNVRGIKLSSMSIDATYCNYYVGPYAVVNYHTPSQSCLRSITNFCGCRYGQPAKAAAAPKASECLSYTTYTLTASDMNLPSDAIVDSMGVAIFSATEGPIYIDNFKVNNALLPKGGTTMISCPLASCSHSSSSSAVK